MNRWAVRIVGILIILVFVLVMMNLQRQLLMMQRNRRPASTTTSVGAPAPGRPAAEGGRRYTDCDDLILTSSCGSLRAGRAIIL